MGGLLPCRPVFFFLGTSSSVTLHLIPCKRALSLLEQASVCTSQLHLWWISCNVMGSWQSTTQVVDDVWLLAGLIITINSIRQIYSVFTVKSTDARQKERVFNNVCYCLMTYWTLLVNRTASDSLVRTNNYYKHV